jgi:multidrug efflux pump subunit AcrB
MEAADEIGLAVIATTFTLIAVFLPTAFMSGVPGKFFVQFGWTAAIAVFFSLVVARLLTPDDGRLPAEEAGARRRPGWMPAYLRLVRWCLHAQGQDPAGGHRVLRRGGLRAALRGPSRARSSRPTTCRRPRSSLELPPGSTFAQTLAVADAAREAVADHPHVQLVYTTVGGGTAGSDPFMPGRARRRRARPR